MSTKMNISQLLPHAAPHLQKKMEPYVHLAQEMEGQFMENLLEQMDKTISRVDEQSFQMGYYNTLLYGEQAKKMAKQNMGIANMILQQIVPNEFIQELYKNSTKGNPYGKNSSQQSQSPTIQKTHRPHEVISKTE